MTKRSAGAAYVCLLAAASCSHSAGGKNVIGGQSGGENGGENGQGGEAGNAAGSAGSVAGGGGTGDSAGAGNSGNGGASGNGAVAGNAGPMDAGAGGSPADAMPSAPVIPTMNGGHYRFDFDGVRFDVDPAIGGRITEFSLDGKNVLTGPAANAFNWGATFWPSPEAAWGWPPPEEIDNLAYAPSIQGDVLVLVGTPSARVNLSVTKRFRVDHAAGAMVLTFDLTNTGNTNASWAPWEVARVAPGGLSFFALGSSGVLPGASKPVPLQQISGTAWFAYDAAQVTASLKSFADGKGWLAHVVPVDRLLFVKTFVDVAANAWAPGEGEVEVYVDSSKKYIELEQQGAFATFAPRQTRSWTVRWYLRKLGPTVNIAVGSADLLNAVAALPGP